MPPEVQRLREMLGSSKHLDDIEGAPYDELEGDVELPAEAVEGPEPSESTFTISSSWESARVLTRLSLTSLLAVYTFISLAAVLYAFYLIRGLLPPSQDLAEKQAPRPGDVESGYADGKCTAIKEKAPDLGNILSTPQISHPPVGVLVNIDENVMMDGESDVVVEGPMPHPAPSEVPPVVEQPWLVPLPPSPPSSPPRRTIQLNEDAPISQPAWAMVASDEQRRSDARTGTAAPAIDLALAMQLRTGFGATADAAWLMRFLMALFGWIAVIVRGGGERQGTGRRLLAW